MCQLELREIVMGFLHCFLIFIERTVNRINSADADQTIYFSSYSTLVMHIHQEWQVIKNNM